MQSHETSHSSKSSEHSASVPVLNLFPARQFGVSTQTESIAENTGLDEANGYSSDRSLDLAHIAVSAPGAPPLEPPPQPSPLILQRRLNIGQSGDKYEVEADKGASQVVNLINSPIFRNIQSQKISSPKELEPESQRSIQRQSTGLNPFNISVYEPGTTPPPPIQTVQAKGDNIKAAPGNIEDTIKSKKGSGEELADNVREPMETAFDANFSGVKVHTDGESDQLNKSLNSRAFATGQDIFFSQGAYNPGSRDGQELLAHELTHVVQQNGKSSVQRLCTECEKEKTQEQIQGKEIDESKIVPSQDNELNNNSNSQTENTTDVTNQNSDHPVNTDDTENIKNDPQNNNNQLKTQKETDNKQENSNNIQPNNNDLENGNVIQNQEQDQKNPKNEPNLEEAKTANNEANQAIQEIKKSEAPTKEGEEKDQQVVDEKEKSQETNNQKGDTQGESSKEQGSTEGENQTEQQTETIANKSQEAQTEVSQTQEEINQSESNSQNLKSQQISFTPPVIKPTFATNKAGIDHINPTEVMGDVGNGMILYQTDDPQTSLAAAEQGIVVQQIPENKIAQSMEAEQRQAELAMSNFMASGGERMAQVSAMGGIIAPKISTSLNQQKAEIDTAIAQNQGIINNAIAQAKNQVQTQAASAREQIATQYNSSIQGIQTSTNAARQKLIQEYQKSTQQLNDLGLKSRQDVDQSFKTGNTKFREAGTIVAGNVDGIVANKQAAFSQQSPPEPGNVVTKFLESFDRDTYVQNWRKAKTDAANEAGIKFKTGLINNANQKADELGNSKGQVNDGISQLITNKSSELEVKYNSALNDLNQSEQQALTIASQTRDGQIQGLDQNLNGTMASLDQMQASQLSQVQNLGQQQKLGIDTQGQQSIASLQQSVAQGTTNLELAYQEFAQQAQGIKTPNLQTINQVIIEAETQLNQIENSTQIALETGINNSTQGLQQQTAQSINSINNIGQQASSQGAEIAQEFATSTTEMVGSATNIFSQLTEGHTSMVQARVDQTVSEFSQLVDNLKQQIQGVITNLDGKLDESATQLQAGLRGSLQGSDQNPSLVESIDKAAEDAAAKVQPAWKSVLKVVIDIVITVAVTVAIAALAASGVGLGAAIGLAFLIGAAGGVLKQAANDMIDGKMSSWQDYAMQAGIGGVTGVVELIGIKGADKALKAITNTVGKYAAKYAIETATDTDTVIDVGTRVASGEQFSLQMLGSSVASSLLSNVGGDLLKGGFGKLGKKLDKVDNKLIKNGAEFLTDTIADTAIDVADNTLIKGEEFSLEMLRESAGTSALSNLVERGANKLYGDKLRSLGHDKSKVDNTTSKPKDTKDNIPKVDNKTSKPKDLTDNDDHRNKQLTPERKAELEQKLENRNLNKEEWKELDRDRRISEKQNQNNTESSTPKKTNQDGNEITQHQDKPEIEPGVVAKEKTADGHEIKILKDGRIVKCSTCGEIRNQNLELFKRRPRLEERLAEIEKISDPQEKSKKAKAFDIELAQIKESEKLALLPVQDVIDTSKIPEIPIPDNDAYTLMRNTSNDIKHIHELTSIPQDLIAKAKQHLMFDKHILLDARTGELRRGVFDAYDPGEDMGIAAWKKIAEGKQPSPDEVEQLKRLIIHEEGEAKILKSDYEAIETLFKRGQLETHLRTFLKRAGVKDEMIDYMIEAESKPIQPYRYAHYVAHYSGYKN
ncbi:DUF4157 domain-containing protein [Aphanizomenon sp. FACHB-1399]|uniref:eCIS core domain-containing protein n=1 Tax=Aphanizomenon sp. FACHB-1399 TaxID=2692773 RepID=UPI001688CB10|nr:DUF4157 domain-containing protein [Aphanizomenon sp. FACHB-1399]MBD2631012.1 DUF4157 domain-containing protein [Aphanizomenon sp. FACHB-1399]